MMPREIVADCECWTGEGPLWHPDERVVYWIDIPTGRLFRYDPLSKNHEQSLEYDGKIGGFTIQENGDLLLFLDNGTVRLWNNTDGFGDTVVEEIPANHDIRFNDVIADPRGRVFCGLMPTNNPAGGGGRLYRLNCDGSLSILIRDIATPNGMGFSPDIQHFYFSETGASRIYKFDYDLVTGALSNKEMFVDVSDKVGAPDGMCVDAEGYVWSAYWNGGCIIRYSSDGVVKHQINLPAKKVSSVTFGGSNYTEVYVTTALGPAEGEPSTKETEGGGAGALFCLRPNVQGMPEFRSCINF